MKLYITESADNIIAGYTHIPIVYGKIDLSEVPNNGADIIVAPNSLNSIPIDSLEEFIQSIVSKMRYGCQTVFGGIDMNALSLAVVRGEVDDNEYNHMVYNNRGIYSSIKVVDILKSLKLKINSVFMNGYNYEISFSRSPS